MSVTAIDNRSVDLFWTDYKDMTKSKTSSYLDLSPLYGSNQEMQDTIRTFKDGKLKPDAYADKRLLGMPPGVSVLLIMFNRFHNHVAENLAKINEGGRFTPPDDHLGEEAKAAAWVKYDNELFQTARLVTSGLYINITLVDYVRNIVNVSLYPPTHGAEVVAYADSDNSSTVAIRPGHWTRARSQASTWEPRLLPIVETEMSFLPSSISVTDGTRASPRRMTNGSRTSTWNFSASQGSS